jgi:Fe2+ transport system protein FeoA
MSIKSSIKPKVEKIACSTLTDVPIGSNVRVVSIDGANATSKRLMEMGVIPGVELTVVKTAPFGDPMEIRVRGYSLAMRRNEAATIEVTF